jgi:hypothetical protein
VLKVLKVYKYQSSGKLIASIGEGGKVIPLNNDFSFSSKGIHRVSGSTNFDLTPYRMEVKISNDGDYQNFEMVRVWNDDHLPEKSDNPDASLEERIDISPSEQFTESERKYVGQRDGSFGIFLCVLGLLSFWLAGLWGWQPPVVMILTGILIIIITKTEGDTQKIEEVKRAKERICKETEEKIKTAMQDVRVWASLDGVQFENYTSRIFREQGFEVEHTPRSNDKGVDLILNFEGQTTIVQCKAYNKNVGVSAVRELQGIKHLWPDANVFMVIALYGFSKQAKEFAEESNIKLYSIVHDYLKSDYRPD